MKVMLLAAGEGRRLQPYTLEKPKPAIPFLTAPLASFSLALLEGMPISQIVVNTHHLPEQIEDLFKWTKLPTKNITFSSEKDLLLGSGGGIHKAMPYLKGKEQIIIMNADEVILPKTFSLLHDMLEFHKGHMGLATLLTMDHPEVGKQFGGAWTGKDQTQVKIFSKTNPGGGFIGHHFVGVMILHPRIFDYFKEQVEVENILYETLTKAMALGEQVHVFNTDCVWYETGNVINFVHAAEVCTQALEENPEQIWVQFLAQTLRVYGEGKLLIEKEQPKLADRIRVVFERQMIRLD